MVTGKVAFEQNFSDLMSWNFLTGLSGSTAPVLNAAYSYLSLYSFSEEDSS